MKSLALTILCTICTLALAQKNNTDHIKAYDYPEKDGIELMNDYEVHIRDAEGGEWIRLKTMRCDVDMHNVQKASFAEFEMGKPVI